MDGRTVGDGIMHLTLLGGKERPDCTNTDKEEENLGEEPGSPALPHGYNETQQRQYNDAAARKRHGGNITDAFWAGDDLQARNADPEAADR